MKFFIVLIAVAVASSSVAVAAPEDSESGLSGVLSGITSGANDLLGEIGLPDLSGLLSNIENIQEIVGPLIKLVLKVIDAIKKLLEKGSTDETLTNLNDAVKELTDFLSKIPPLKPLLDLINQLLENVLANKDNSAALQQALKPLQAILEKLLGALQSVNSQ